MGWGICFALDAHGRVYCADGCKWKSTAADYAEYPPWPSARQSVLDYFEYDAHSELDMIRDEFPGTAGGLHAACEEHIGAALARYAHLSAEEKCAAHEAALAEFEGDVSRLKTELAAALETYKERKKAWQEYKKNPPKVRKAKTRADELRQLMAPLRLELELEEVAEECDRLRRAKASATRMLNLEKKFSLNDNE
jgi:exonuclease VII large subunit